MNRGCPDEKKERGHSQQKEQLQRDHIGKRGVNDSIPRTTGCDGGKGRAEQVIYLRR